MSERNSLFECHHQLSRLCHAVKLALAPIPVQVAAEWHDGTYLSVRVVCQAKQMQRVVDQLNHGALAGGYDYRFEMISYPSAEGLSPWDYVTVSAKPNMFHAASG